MIERQVRTQAELDAALKAGEYPILVGNGYFELWDSATVSASGSATVSASDSATVRAWDSATVSAWGSATVSASDSATVRAWDSATVRAWDSATVRASGSATVRAWGSATVSAKVTVSGGVQVRPPDTVDGPTWCEHHGVDVVDGVATLFKAVQDDWRGPHKTQVVYRPGMTPAAPDWDGGKQECGRGLHFAPTPWQAITWCDDWAHIVACPVRVSDIAAHGFDAQFPDKAKARAVAEPIYEVDRDGNRIAEAVAT